MRLACEIPVFKIHRNKVQFLHRELIDVPNINISIILLLFKDLKCRKSKFDNYIYIFVKISVSLQFDVAYCT